MSAKLKNNWSFIELITTTSNLQAQALLNTLSTSQIETVIEIILNLLHHNISLSPDIIKKLKRYKRFFRDLTAKSITLSKKKTDIRRKRALIVYLLQKVKPHLQNQL